MTSGKIYKIRLQASNSIGNSVYSYTVRYAMVDPIATPAIPTIMQQFTSNSQIGIQWYPVIPVIGQEIGQEVIGYMLYAQEVNKAS